MKGNGEPIQLLMAEDDPEDQDLVRRALTSARLAVEKADDRIANEAFPIAASDGFFPFSDGPELLIKAGVKCIVQPGGSKRDRDTIDLCNEHDVTLLMTGVRHFKH